MTESLDNKTSNPAIWYGWVILGMVFFALSTMIALRNSLGYFFKSMIGEFGWSRAETAGAFSVGMIVQSICSPFFGWLGERWSLRWLMVLGVLFGGAAFLIGPFIDSLWKLYLMYALLNIGFTAASFIPQVLIISNWFVRRRGLAVGISNSSQGFAYVLNLVLPMFIALIGWRNSHLVMAAFTLMITLPLTALLLRDHPREKNTVPDAPFLSPMEISSLVAKEQISSRNADALAKPKYLNLILSLPFALIGATYGSIAFAFVSTIVHLIPHATDQGFTPKESAFIALVWGLCVIAANLVSGISDRIGRAPTYAVGTAVGVGAYILLAIFLKGMSPGLFYFGTAMSGLGIGLTRPTAASLLADHFAGLGFGQINGLTMLIFALFGAAGGYVTGILFDHFETYQQAFFLVATSLLISAGFAIPLALMKRTIPEC